MATNLYRFDGDNRAGFKTASLLTQDADSVLRDVERGDSILLTDDQVARLRVQYTMSLATDPVPASPAIGSEVLSIGPTFEGATLVVEGDKPVWRTRRGGLPSSSGLNEINDLILWAQNHGKKHLALDERDYDNSVATLSVPAGFEIHGASRDTTRLLLPTAGVQAEVLNYGIVDHLRWEVKAPDGNFALGYSPNPSGGGIKLWSKAQVNYTFGINLHIFFNLWGDHQHLSYNETVTCGVGVFRSANGQSRGNLELVGNRFTGNALAAFFVTEDIEEDSLNSEYNDFSFNPYGWFANNSGSGQNEFGFTNVQSRGDSFEALGYRGVQLGSRKISGTMWGPRAGANDADYAITDIAGSTWETLLMGTNQDYTFTSGNVSDRDAASNFGQFSIQGDWNPPDTSNGPFITPGGVGVFEVV